MSSSLYLVFEYMEHDLSGLAAVQGVKVTEPQARVVTSCNFYAASCNFGMTNINPSLVQRFSSPFLHLLSSSMDKTVRLWHLSGKSCLKVFSHSDYGRRGGKFQPKPKVQIEREDTSHPDAVKSIMSTTSSVNSV